jgi:hypothetical protein
VVRSLASILAAALLPFLLTSCGDEPSPTVPTDVDTDCIDYADCVHYTGSIDTPGQAWCVAVSGAHAFVADGSAGLQVIDIGDPASPKSLSAIAVPGLSFGVAISGNYAYVAAYGDGLQVIDISTPASPQNVGAIATRGHARAVVVSDTLAYVADGRWGLRVIDVSDPTSPEFLGEFDTGSRGARRGHLGQLRLRRESDIWSQGD